MEPFIAEVRMFGYAFAPKGWALCDGQQMPIAQNQALYALIRNYYGGDDKTFFNLPDLQGRVVVGVGQSPDGEIYEPGDTGGKETVQLTTQELASHVHYLGCTISPGDTNTPAGHTVTRMLGATAYIPPPSSDQWVNMAAGGTTSAGSGAAHNNMQPFQTLSYCIAIEGIYPLRP